MAENKNARGKDKVIVILKKDLCVDAVNEICYETRQNSFNGKFDGSTITLEITDLYAIQLGKHWNEKQPNANELITNKTAKLVIYCGNVEGLSGQGTQLIQITNDGIFIAWQVESTEYLTSIATSLKQNKKMSVFMELDVDDEFFVIAGALHNAGINRIAITFN